MSTSTTDTLTAFDLYSQEVNRYPLLSPEQEIDLARRYQAGDQDAGHFFICCNLRLAMSVVKNYSTNARVERLDLVQQANLGLMKAVEKYDPESGNRFSTSAVPWILTEVTRYRDEQSQAVRVPQHAVIVQHQWVRGAGLAKDARTLAAAQLWLNNECSSLDSMIPGQESEIGSYAELFEDPRAEEAFAEALDQSEVAALLDQLSDRSRRVIERLYGFAEVEQQHNQSTVGKLEGVSRTRIEQIEQQALELLRHILVEQGVERDVRQSWVSKDDSNYVSMSEVARLADCCQSTCTQIIKRLALPLYRVEGKKRRVLARSDVPRVQAAVCRASQMHAKKGRAAS